MKTTLEYICYIGPLVSFIMFLKMVRMRSELFLNKMLLFYFLLDGVLGSLEIHYLFKIERHR